MTGVWTCLLWDYSPALMPLCYGNFPKCFGTPLTTTEHLVVIVLIVFELWDSSRLCGCSCSVSKGILYSEDKYSKYLTKIERQICNKIKTNCLQ